MTYPTPILGTIVNVYPRGSDEPWEAKIVGFTSDGLIRVKSVKYLDDSTVQTISRDGRVEIIESERADGWREGSTDAQPFGGETSGEYGDR